VSQEIRVWHYGLMAERWAEFLHDTPELSFLKAEIDRHGQPVLDLACGAGRLLLPLRSAGMDIDGCDLSADMLAQCQRLAQEQGLTVELHQAPMHDFHLPRRYRTIYLIGSFGLAGSRQRDLETLRRCYQHLEPGGALVFNIQAEYTSPDTWDRWLTEQAGSLPEPWPTEGRARTASDASEHHAYFRLISMDPLEQTYERQVRLEKWQRGELVDRQELSLRGQMYLKNEVLWMLELAGFGDVELHGDYTPHPASAESDELVFTAIRQE